MLLTYDQAGGSKPIVLFHDGQHGTALIDALARHGTGLPANVLPLAVNEDGLETIVAAFAYGAASVRFLLRAKPLHDIAGLSQTVAMAEAILSGLGFSGRRVATIETDDPDSLGEALRGIKPAATVKPPATFRTVGKAARPASFRLERTAPPGTSTDRCDFAARGRASWHDQRQSGRMHAVPVLRIGVSHGRASRRSRTSGAQVC
jgi:hypothetical protein